MPATTHPAATCVAPQRLNRWLQLHLCWLPQSPAGKGMAARARGRKHKAKVLVAVAAASKPASKPADELVCRQLHGVTSKGGCHLRFLVLPGTCSLVTATCDALAVLVHHDDLGCFGAVYSATTYQVAQQLSKCGCPATDRTSAAV